MFTDANATEGSHAMAEKQLARIPATLIPGDGIGPEITAAVVDILDALGAPFDWDQQKGGMAAVESAGDPLPPMLLESVRRTGLALKGPLTTPVGGGFRSVNVRLREEFGLYANLRPVRTLATGGRYEDIDIVLVGENLEGLYVALEHSSRLATIRGGRHFPGVNTRAGASASCASPSTMLFRQPQEGHHRPQGERAEGAHRHLPRGRARIAANTKDGCDGRAHRRCLRHATGHESMAVRRDRHDHLFGDILSDQIAGLVGGLGMAPGANIGPKRRSSRLCTARPRTSPAKASPSARAAPGGRTDAGSCQPF